jgi:hypothetical protein
VIAWPVFRRSIAIVSSSRSQPSKA